MTYRTQRKFRRYSTIMALNLMTACLRLARFFRALRPRPSRRA
ncbi:hypothetical protein [Brevundimonas sp. TWP1-2-1b1]